MNFKLSKHDKNYKILRSRLVNAHQRIAAGLHEKKDPKLTGKILTHMACSKILTAMIRSNEALISFEEVMATFEMPEGIKFKEADLYKVNIKMVDCY